MTAKTAPQSLLCCHPGCCRPWTSDYLGRQTCGEHVAEQRQGLQVQRPLLPARLVRDALPPFNERAEREGDAA
jgi:hypothetical protein